MTLIARVSRLFTADFHAVLDQVEEPEVLLRQAIREMDDGLAATELQSRRMQQRLDDVQRREQALELSITEINAQLDTCFDSDKDELAREFIKRKLETEQLLKQLQSQRASLEKDVLLLQETIAENQSTLVSMRQKAELYAASSVTEYQTVSGVAAGDHPQPFVDENDIEVAFLQEKQQRAAS